MPRKQKSKAKLKNPADESLLKAQKFLAQHPLFTPLAGRTAIVFQDVPANECPNQGWAIVRKDGHIHVRPTRKLKAEHWIYILAHQYLHLGLGHFKSMQRPHEWNAACCAFTAKFLQDLKIGEAPNDLAGKIELPSQDEDSLYKLFLDQGIPQELARLGTAGENCADMLFSEDRSQHIFWRPHQRTFEESFANGLKEAVTSAVNVAAGITSQLGSVANLKTVAEMARSWFISSYPLFGALAASFKLVEDLLDVCRRLDISIAAVDCEMKEIYVNPTVKLSEQEMRFVLSHEFLHAGLAHESRRHGRDHFLWNVACDFVINGWLMEMGIGDVPPMGILYDPTLKGLSGEEVYLRIASDIRRYRKLATLAGVAVGDVIEHSNPDWWSSTEGVNLDEFYRRCLAERLRFHQEAARGFLPSGLVEEIRALSQPAIPWEVELAQWFDNYFSPIEKMRSYARPSRRQSATPDIARPRYVAKEGALDGRTFAVVLDTSGSMDRSFLAKALGSIAGYSIARDVPFVRLIFCDAAAYDEGYVPPEQIAKNVKVKGRGGTILQPGIDLVETTKNFPEKGPILVITDGFCDRLTIRREHAFLIPQGRHLPFVPKGKVFYIK